MNVELRTLRYFLAAAQEENITRAADILHITQPTLSRQIMDLERELGTTLMKRGKNGLTLTDDGIFFRQRAEEIVELADRLEKEIHKRGEENIYRFRLKGMRDPDIEFSLNHLCSRYRIAEIIDSSEPQYDFSALFAQHPSDMIGFYIQALQKKDMSPVEKKALYYGINALLHTTDERS